MRTTFAKKLMGLTMSVMLTAFAAVPFTAHAASDVTINWNDVKQEIDGFGVSQAGWSDAIYDLQEPVRSEIMDLLFKPDTLRSAFRFSAARCSRSLILPRDNTISTPDRTRFG